MWHVVCGENRAYHTHVSMIPFIRFLPSCCMHCAVQQNKSLHVAICADVDANPDGEIHEMTSLSRASPHNIYGACIAISLPLTHFHFSLYWILFQYNLQREREKSVLLQTTTIATCIFFSLV